MKEPAEKTTPTAATTTAKGVRRPVKCFNCGNFGHISMHCPSKASYLCKDGWGRSVARVGQVEGTAVSDILLDTGCTRTMVRRDLVPEERLLPGEAVTILCAHGDMALYPLAMVRIEVGEVQEVIGDGGEEPVVGGEFADDMFGVPAAREKKTRSQKRRERRVHGLVRAKDGPSRGRQSEDALDLSPEELQRLQETDDTLERVVEGDRVFRRNGVLYRRWVPRGQPEEAVTEQLVLPKQCRRTVLQLAHSIPLGGHLGKKKDGSLRLCVDYRRLNAMTRADAYPMPRIEDMIDQLGKAKYLTTLDLTKGYWQVPVAEEDRPKTTFTTPFGLFQFLRMPFGLQGAPATFQRMIDRLLQGLGQFANAYLDDVVIFSESWEEHLRHIETVLTRLRESGLTAKPRKCQFGMAQCVYLGHVVGGGRVQVEHSKVEAIQRMPRPQTKKEVRAFLGLTGYYRKFIPGYSSLATALTDLTRKDQPAQVSWTADCEEAFNRLKGLLCSAPVL